MITFVAYKHDESVQWKKGGTMEFEENITCLSWSVEGGR